MENDEDHVPPPGCPVCGGTGLIIGIEDGVVFSVPCQCIIAGGAGVLWPPPRPEDTGV